MNSSPFKPYSLLCNRHRGPRRLIAGLLLASLTACTTFQPVSPREYIPISHPRQIYITRSDNSVVVMQLPKLLGDTLVGYVNGDYQEMTLSQAKQVNARVAANGRTAVAVAAAVSGVAVASALMIGSGGAVFA